MLECGVRPTRTDEGRSNTSEDCVPVIRKDSTLNFEQQHLPLDNALSDLGCFHSTEVELEVETNKRQS